MRPIRRAVLVLATPLLLLSVLGVASSAPAPPSAPDSSYCDDPSFLPHTPDSAEEWLSHCPVEATA
ncbi:hypothetical protein [Nocardioides sp. OK12]|uniref:hypothetical protein n=1 Tax=Nocardioides sp. OK12 TaxID=2758661 RepID=UPI0021C40304|nr:hypothetical protein [Nocardioides sp. OK12]